MSSIDQQRPASTLPSQSLRNRVRGQASTLPQPQPRAKRPLRQVEAHHIQLAILATEACAKGFFDELTATPQGLMDFDQPRFLDAIQQAVREAVDRTWRQHPAIRAQCPFDFTDDRAVS